MEMVVGIMWKGEKVERFPRNVS